MKNTNTVGLTFFVLALALVALAATACSSGAEAGNTEDPKTVPWQRVVQNWGLPSKESEWERAEEKDGVFVGPREDTVLLLKDGKAFVMPLRLWKRPLYASWLMEEWDEEVWLLVEESISVSVEGDVVTVMGPSHTYRISVEQPFAPDWVLGYRPEDPHFFAVKKDGSIMETYLGLAKYYKFLKITAP